jgi:hypothetical protein
MDRHILAELVGILLRLDRGATVPITQFKTHSTDAFNRARLNLIYASFITEKDGTLTLAAAGRKLAGQLSAWQEKSLDTGVAGE